MYIEINDVSIEYKEKKRLQTVIDHVNFGVAGQYVGIYVIWGKNMVTEQRI